MPGLQSEGAPGAASAYTCILITPMHLLECLCAGHGPCVPGGRRPGAGRTRSARMRDPWLPESGGDELEELFARDREAWRGALHPADEPWSGDDASWRGAEHLAEWPEHAAGPEYWMFK